MFVVRTHNTDCRLMNDENAFLSQNGSTTRHNYNTQHKIVSSSLYELLTFAIKFV